MQVSSVVLDNGDELPAELVIIGAGIIPATKFVKAVRGLRPSPPLPASL